MSVNQFTLEELERISYLVEKSLQWSGDDDELNIMDKLDTLIANYCDHDFDTTYRMREVCACTKCGLETL